MQCGVLGRVVSVNGYVTGELRYLVYVWCVKLPYAFGVPSPNVHVRVMGYGKLLRGSGRFH